MRKIFKEVYSLDKRCYELGMSEDVLMENAARAMYEEIKSKKVSSVCIVAGPGNNGADGISLARMLLGEVDVHLFLPLGAKSEMAKLQLKRYKNFGGNYSEFEIDKFASIIMYDCYVDAIFGSGLKRDLDNKINKIIRALNKKESFKIACDIPTGLDDNGNKKGEVFKADVTITMGAEKLSLYSDNAKDFTGIIKIANLGVSFESYTQKSNFFVLEKKDMTLPIRKQKTSHKGTYGHLGVLVGEKEGAGIIASLAGINFGAGLVTAVTKEKIQIPYEIMHSNSIENYSALAFGMGMGNFYDDELKNICKMDIPKVIDADMFYKKEIIECLENKKIVLTPHPKEFASLLKISKLGEYSVDEIQNNRFELASKFTQKYPNVVLLLKGSNVIIAYKNQLYINPYGTPALSKGGSGDVLTGMIGSLLAQNYHPLKATITASLAHSFASDIKPNYNLTPLKLIENLGKLD